MRSATGRAWPVAAWLVAAWLAVPGVALAAPRLTVGPVSGETRSVLPTQLAGALCASFECVLWGEVSSRRAPDLRKARAHKVGGILIGAIQAPPAKRSGRSPTAASPA